jgi:hypothetical protein
MIATVWEKFGSASVGIAIRRWFVRLVSSLMAGSMGMRRDALKEPCRFLREQR